ncbi:MAG: glycoside hydrolase family 2 TIM barrel-domain containing protein [Pseudomonadota bacterium]
MKRGTGNFYLIIVLFLGGCARHEVATVHESAAVAVEVSRYADIDSFSRSLNGQWMFLPNAAPETDTPEKANNSTAWEAIKVPANWYLQGHDFSGLAWYKKRFLIEPKDRNKTFSLHLKGVDYQARIWLNGSLVGQQEGSFQSFDYDITELINYDGVNELYVHVDSPLETADSWSLRKQLIKGVLSHHDTRPGGAWSDRGQEKNTGGIWDDVTLNVSNGVQIRDIKITPRLKESAPDIADLRVEFLNHTKSTKTVSVKVQIEPHGFRTNSVSRDITGVIVNPGEQTLSIQVPVANAKRWWPVGHGVAHLYTANVTLYDESTIDSSTHSYLALDEKQSRFGFRSVFYDQEKGYWLINGRRLFLRGTNYIASQWLSEMDIEKFRTDVSMMVDGGVNIVRVHAHIEPQRFYDVCDELGLLVWQDFPLQWGYEDTDGFTANAIRQANEMVDDFYNHPSIVVWSLHNEPPWDADWMKWKYPDYQPGQNQTLDDKLFAAVSKMDSNRYVHKYSATAEHPWYGWYSGVWQDYAKPTEHKLITEYGAQALPSKGSLMQFLSEPELWPDTEEEWQKWEYHNFQRRENFELAKVSMGSNIDEFIENSQGYQARLIKFAGEAYRRQRYQPVGAIFQFMFVENWPSMNWAVVDYWRKPKSGYFAMKTSFQMVLPSIEWEREEFRVGEFLELGLWAINDKWQDYPNASFRYELVHLPTRVVTTDRKIILLAADSSQKVTDLRIQLVNAGRFELRTSIVDKSGVVLGTNSHQFNVVSEGYAQN